MIPFEAGWYAVVRIREQLNSFEGVEYRFELGASIGSDCLRCAVARNPRIPEGVDDLCSCCRFDWNCLRPSRVSVYDCKTVTESLRLN